VASYQAVAGALDALESYLEVRMAGGLDEVVENPDVRILSSQELRTDPPGNQVGLYLHRISVDPFGRNRYLRSTQPSQPPQPELPVNLHVLIIGWTATAAAEATLVAWAMQEIGASLELDVSHLGLGDPRWGEQDRLQVIPEEMSTEDLMRVWDSLPGDYRLSSPYILKTLRLEPTRTVTAGPPVQTIVMPIEEH
jgi:hypothetical protein